jgi:hypothetical protein
MNDPYFYKPFTNEEINAKGQTGLEGCQDPAVEKVKEMVG